MARRPISPKTEALYSQVLSRAFGDLADSPHQYRITKDVLAWPDSVRALLRAACKRRLMDAELDPEPLLKQIPVRWAPKRSVEIPSEDEALAYEAAAAKLGPGRHALVLLPLVMGLRSNEVVTLTRSSVDRAARTGELLVMRKGGKEQRLPGKHAMKLFKELLEVPAGHSRALTSPLDVKGKQWKIAGEILSGGQPIAMYHQLRKLVRATSEAAGLDPIKPHRLRHAMATRMARDGAPIQVIQWMLGHANLATTMIYVHPGASEAEAFLRGT